MTLQEERFSHREQLEAPNPGGTRMHRIRAAEKEREREREGNSHRGVCQGWRVWKRSWRWLYALWFITLWGHIAEFWTKEQHNTTRIIFYSEGVPLDAVWGDSETEQWTTNWFTTVVGQLRGSCWGPLLRGLQCKRNWIPGFLHWW